jgi:acyl-CoA thioester hydrolase
VIRADGICVMFDVRTDTSRALTDDERAYWTRYLEE